MSNTTHFTLAGLVARLQHLGFEVVKSEEFAGGEFLVVEARCAKEDGTFSTQIHTFKADKTFSTMLDVEKRYVSLETDKEHENVKF